MDPELPSTIVMVNFASDCAGAPTTITPVSDAARVGRIHRETVNGTRPESGRSCDDWRHEYVNPPDASSRENRAHFVPAIPSSACTGIVVHAYGTVKSFPFRLESPRNVSSNE